jgi:lipopolysaccharide transport system ATP-binding protein
MNRVEIKAKFDEIVAFAEVEKFLDTPVKRYSSGMYVRLAFAVAAHLEPEILIVDEVLAVGDTEFQKKCLGKMKDVASGGRTVLFVSHNLDAVAKLCPNALMLRSGELNSSGSTQQVITEYLRQSRESRPSKSQPQGSKGLVVSLQFPNEGVVVSGESTQIQLVCETAEECNLQELALIIESERGQRVGLIDFRLAGRPIVIRPNMEEIFTALIENIELVPGQYSAKLYASGDGLQQDIEMGDFEVLEKPNRRTLSLYHKEINGIVTFRGRVTRRTVAIQIETPNGLESGKNR